MDGTRVTVTDGLEISIDHGKVNTLVRLTGRLNIESSPRLRDQLLALLNEELPVAITVDLAGASYVDASGIATLIEGLKIARNRQTKLCLKGLQGRVLHLFEVTGMLPLFEVSGCGSSSARAKVL